MACYSPLLGSQTAYNEKGKRPVHVYSYEVDMQKRFDPEKNPGVEVIRLPCGQCIGCRLDKAKEWAARCYHEAAMHKENSFITLTYNDQNLPEDRSIDKKHLQNFFKKFRKHIRLPGIMPLFDKAMRIQYYKAKWHKNYGKSKVAYAEKPIRYYSCGEYGEEKNRPHYHIILFGHTFKDQELIHHDAKSVYQNKFKVNNNHSLYTSKLLEQLWAKGFVTIGEVNEQSAGYVARYCTKKITGEMAKEHYQGREPEFALMSRMPGIGKTWYDQFKTDVYPKDYFTIKGQKYQPSRYYDTLLERKDPELMAELKAERRKKSIQLQDWKPRLIAREKVKQLQTKSLVRGL